MILFFLRLGGSPSSTRPDPLFPYTTLFRSLSQSGLLDSYPREQHGSAMAMWGVGVMVGPILGPTLGGYLTDAYNWRWVFYINLFVGVATRSEEHTSELQALMRLSDAVFFLKNQK